MSYLYLTDASVLENKCSNRNAKDLETTCKYEPNNEEFCFSDNIFIFSDFISDMNLFNYKSF